MWIRDRIYTEFSHTSAAAMMRTAITGISIHSFFPARPVSVLSLIHISVSIRCGLTDILPTECSCERLIGLFGELDCWQEDDNYTPLPGDIIFYDWDEKWPGDCTGWADHVGIVVGTKWPFVKVIEGNRDDAVAYRVIPLGEIHIRGYGLPDYAAVAENTL